MNIRYSARSHIGLVRDKNEDNLYVDGVFLDESFINNPFSIDGYSERPIILAICDGMGGEQNGEEASQIAVKALNTVSFHTKNISFDDALQLVQEYANDVNAKIHSKYEDINMRVGTTLALVAVTRCGIMCYSIGDTRIYTFGKKGLCQITNDHTLAADKVKSGIITKEQANVDKDRHKLLRCIGIGDDHTVEGYPIIRSSCRLLICSDGLTDMVSDSDIELIMRRMSNTSNAADELLYLALQNGGRDNTSIIVADVSMKKERLLSIFRR